MYKYLELVCKKTVFPAIWLIFFEEVLKFNWFLCFSEVVLLAEKKMRF